MLAILIVMLGGSVLALRTSYFQTIITKRIAKELSQQTNTNISIGHVDIAFFKKVILKDLLIEDQKSDTLFFTERVLARIDSLKIRKHRIALNELRFENNHIKIDRDSAEHFNFSFLLDSLKTERDTLPNWVIKCNQFGFQGSDISYHDIRQKNKKNVFLYDLNLNISEFKNYKDSIQFRINSLDMNDGKNLFLDQLSAFVNANENKIEIKSINIKSKNSIVEDSEFTLRLKNDSTQSNIKPEINFQLNQAKISMAEVAELLPSLKGMNQKIDLSGRIYGSLDDIKGKNINLKTGSNTSASLDFYINGITAPETMYLFLDLKQCTSTFSDLSKIRLPNRSGLRYLEFPQSFYGSGLLSYTGNFSGFLTDFVTFGTLESELGTLETDISVVPKEDQDIIRYRGKVSTELFQLGNLLDNETIGDASFNGEIDGNYDNTNNTISGLFKGDIFQIEINDYLYKNIQMDGLYVDQMFDGLLRVNDPNLKFDFQGQFDLNELSPEFNFNLSLNRFLPGNLNLSDKFPKAQMAFNMKAQFTGNKIDNLKGVIHVNDGTYENSNGTLNLKNMQLVSIPNDSTKTLTFTSEFLDFEIEGNYRFQNILNSFRRIANHFIPAIEFTPSERGRPNVFDYEIDAKDLNKLADIFYPDLTFDEPFLLYGKINSEQNDFELAGSIPGIQYKKFWVRNVFIGNKIIDEKYSSIFKLGEVLHQNGMELYDFTIDTEIADNISNNLVTWNNNLDSTLHSEIESETTFFKADSTSFPGIVTRFFPAKIFIADSSWQFGAFDLSIDTTTMAVNDFNIYRGSQFLSAHGIISKEDTSHMSVNFKDIDLGFVTKSFEVKKSFGGNLDCSVVLSGMYNEPVVLSNITVDSFTFEDYLVGNLELTSHWGQNNEVINSELDIVKNNRTRLKTTGYYNPKTKELNYEAVADSLSLKLLGAVIKRNLSEFEGHAHGKVLFNGSIDNIELNGALQATNAGLTVDYTKGSYTFTDSVYFKKDTIQFDNITIADIHENEGKFNGVLVHNNFKDFIYNLTINSPRILALNTTIKDNEQFFGKIYANCKLDIIGEKKSVELGGTATSLRGTDLSISMEYEGDVEQYDFFAFRTTEENEVRKRFFEKNTNGDFGIKLTVEVTPDAKIQLIYNSRIGDVIKAQGEGILLFEMDDDYNISLSGDYTLTQGDYLFTLQNVMNKRFTIDQGSTIIWSGDPYNAIVDLTAIYRLKASLYDLMIENYLIDDIYQRIPVECKILLTEELTNPVIDFEIDFPEEDETTIGILQQFINTEEEMNKQILSLIVLGKFYTPEYLRGTYESQNQNTLGTTASEVFSNQLSNWLSQISSDVDVGFNYRPGNSITNDEIELALSTQIFNDRVTLNGNVGNNVNPESNNSSQIVGDFDMKVKLNRSGKIQFKAFNRSNNNLIYETAPYTQGIGFIFKEEYNSLNELAHKIGSLFRKKEKPKP